MARFLWAFVLLSGLLHADDWPAAQGTETFSRSGDRFVRITPGESYGDMEGFVGQPKGRYARAETFERAPDGWFRLVAAFDLVHPVAPVDVLLSDAGRLITFDNWHNAGYGEVVAVYDPWGELVRAFALEDLYTKDRLAEVPSSVSSRWWRCKPHGWSDPQAQNKVYLHEFQGGHFVFDLTSGEQVYEAGQSPCTP